MATGRPAGRCSFCDIGADEVALLIAGRSGVAICDRCAALCGDILAEELGPAPPTRDGAILAELATIRLALTRLAGEVAGLREEIEALRG